MKTGWGSLLPVLALPVLLVPVSWGLGAGECGFREIFALLTGGDVPESTRAILLEIRLPRVVAALLAGGMLAAAGAAGQNLFRNDLASPHVLGVVNAAALGAIAGVFLNSWLIVPLALCAGVGSILLLFWIGGRKNWDGATLILAGIAVNAFASAATSGALYLADERLQSLVFWLLGGFWRITWQSVILLAGAAVIGWGGLWVCRREMDVLLLGDRGAALSGVRLKTVKPLVMFCMALLTAAVVSCCGVIGFVGLAVPHMVRRFGGASFSRLLPLVIPAGGGLLLAADIPARLAMAPQEIPVGILTALVGGPFFFYLLLRKTGGGHD
ncbi:MAG: iron ABC transporter permease [Lentisphaeria bacterium]|nr:iron ABC transporter permease [Lentisphaeria bacterium]